MINYLLQQKVAHPWGDLSRRMYFGEYAVFAKKITATVTLDRKIIKCKSNIMN